MKCKTGKCIDCGKDAPLVAKRCSSCYWPYRRSLKAGNGKEAMKKSVIPVKSAKRLDQDIAYSKLRKSWLPDHPNCQARLSGCEGTANQVHHMQGREGLLLLDTNRWLAVCNNCHHWITEHSAESIAIGLSLRRNN